ncbi:hypothetical protein DEA8626_03090 [Defluviimonas aquaemixtae]|uniref:DUF3306 domain-containing protein n=1 Tax=Albidovulum aquaemixtae TaxID=1542388 RepID=A0A2R8BKT0_9RHOB|nr:DUF3306 domain-containing protein [Defluviimonas aquaemixtae]SPH24042.1 hypothetical protein DEA8626_03090 [Defluviimonas aquaemixtae]
MARFSDTADFWSRRRAAVRAEAEAAEAARLSAAAAAEQEALRSARDGKSEADMLEELGLPDPDALEQGDDFKAFLQAAVPEHIRRRALRRLWRSNPVLANLDGLVDHGEDFSDAATVSPGMATAYEVGRGMIRRAAELVEATPANEEEAAEFDAAGAPTCARTDPPEVEVASEPTQSEVDDPVAAALPRRHMRFTFVT